MHHWLVPGTIRPPRQGAVGGTIAASPPTDFSEQATHQLQKGLMPTRSGPNPDDSLLCPPLRALAMFMQRKAP